MPAAAMIVEDQDGYVLLLLRGPTAPWMPLRWCLPGGKIEPGELPAEAAARELLEETSLRAPAVVPLVAVDGCHVFYAQSWSGTVALLDGEHATYAWVPRQAVGTWDVVQPHCTVLRWFGVGA